MSASHTPVRVRWGLPLFGLALALAALIGLIVISSASAAPLPPATAAPPAEFGRGLAPPALTATAHPASVNAEALTHSTAAYRLPSIPAAPIRPADDTPFARANAGFDSVDGYYGPNAFVEYVITSNGSEISRKTGQAKADGWMNGVNCGCDMQPGDVVTVNSPPDGTGFHAVLHLIPITGTIDVDADVVSGQMPDVALGEGGNVEVWSKATDQWNSVDITIGAGGSYLANFKTRDPSIDIQNGDRAQVWYIDANKNWVGDVLYTPSLFVRANQSYDRVQGESTPQTLVQVTVMRDGKEIGYGESNTGGGNGWNVNPRQPDGNNVDMRAGDIVKVKAGLLYADVPLIEMAGAVDSVTDVVSGKLDVTSPADVRVEVWREDGASRDLKTNALGNFSIDFGAFDIHQGDQVGIWYVLPDGNMAGIVRSDFRIEVELRDNDLWGMATPSSRVDLEVRTSTGTLKGTTTVWTDQEGNYGTDFRDALDQRVDIQAGDVINGTNGTKHATLAIPSPFDAAYDYSKTAQVCGHAPVGTKPRVDLWGFGTQYPTGGGTTPFCATFGGSPGIEAEGESRLDLASGHSVLYRFRTPTPMLWLNKWSDGQPPSGGYHRYTLRVGNHERADMTASGATLVDTLPSGMTYVSADPPKSGQTDNMVTWNLADLAPGTERDITLTVSVDDTILDPGDEVENCATVTAADWERDTGDNKSCDKRTVTENLADLAIGGNVIPGDPAPGQEYIYRIDFGNKRQAGTRNVEIIDTLPSGTTYVSEWHPEGWTAQTTTESGKITKITWDTDYLPGGRGRYLELKLRVDSGATPGTTQLHNRVEIAGEAPDADANNNVWENDAGVKEPYGNVSVGKEYSHGIPVAGYEYATWIHVWNEGNVPATGVVLNDTLPASATFVRATQYMRNEMTGNYDGTDAPPTAQGTGWVHWSLPAIPTWRDVWMEVTFRIGASTTPGTELVNQADVTLSGDQDPNNNHAEYRFHTQAPGANLRVTKWYDWGDVEPGGNVQYQLRFENDGTAPLYDLVFKDILPDHVTLNDVGWKWNDQPAIDGKTLTWTLPWQLNPGDQQGFWLQIRVNDGTPVGTLLTNIAQGASSTAEVLDTDNTAEVTLAVGPDLRVEKELLDTQWIRPGEHMRYRIRVWNDGHAWARNAVLTDILPAGMTFVGSDRGGKDQGNNTIVWDTRDLPPGWRDEFDMEVEVAPGLAVGSKLKNVLEITSDGEDADPDDNTFELTSYVPFRSRLPLILKGK